MGQIKVYRITHWQRVLYTMFCAEFLSMIGFSSISPFLPLYLQELRNTNGHSIEFLSGIVYSISAFTMMFASPFWGILADRHGRKLMVERSMFGGAIVILMMTSVRSVEALVVLRAIQGLVTGTMAAASALVAAESPREQTGYGMGMLQVGISSGLALGPLVGGSIADALDYHAAFYGTSALLFIAGVIVHFGIQEDKSAGEIQSTRNGSILLVYKHILSTKVMKIAYIMSFTSQLGRTMIIPIVPLFIQTLLIDSPLLNTYIGSVIGIASVTTTLSAIYLGKLGDRYGHHRIIFTCSIFASLLYLLQGFVVSIWQLLFLQAFVGLALGGIVPSISALLARFSSAGEEGAVYGLDNSINSAARACAPVLGSAIAIWFNLRTPFAVASFIYLFIGILAIGFSQMVNSRTFTQIPQ